jgi:hypothetical protein
MLSVNEAREAAADAVLKMFVCKAQASDADVEPLHAVLFTFIRFLTMDDGSNAEMAWWSVWDTRSQIQLSNEKGREACSRVLMACSSSSGMPGR